MENVSDLQDDIFWSKKYNYTDLVYAEGLTAIALSQSAAGSLHLEGKQVTLWPITLLDWHHINLCIIIFLVSRLSFNHLLHMFWGEFGENMPVFWKRAKWDYKQHSRSHICLYRKYKALASTG